MRLNLLNIRSKIWRQSFSYFAKQEFASIYKMSSYADAFWQSVCFIMTNRCNFEPSIDIHNVVRNISVNVVACT